jgi:hypothetical protein
MIKFPNFLKTNKQLVIEELTRVKDECQTALTELMTKNMKTDDLDDIKSKIIDFKTKYDEFINVYQNAKNLKDSKLFYEVNKLQDTFNPLEEEFIIRYLNYLATQLNGTVQKTNNLKKGFTYYRLENYELKKLGVFSSKTSNHSNEMHGESYNTFDSLNDKIDRHDTEKYYIEVKPEGITLGGNPRRTRRRKNKKRRSSKQQKSKK